MLRGFGLQLSGGSDEGQQCDVDVGEVAAPHIPPEFTDGLEKGERFDVANRASDLRDHHIGIAVRCHPVDALADLPCDVGDHLHRPTVVVASSFFVDHRLVDRSRGHAVEA